MPEKGEKQEVESEKAGLAAIVGEGKVLDGSGLLEGYSRDMSFRTPLKPWFVVKPGNPDEIQKIVTWANETRTPLIPVSSGLPHFNGDTVPTAAGAIIVDLSGMKQIIHIDHRNRMAMIEPGVTFSQLTFLKVLNQVRWALANLRVFFFISSTASSRLCFPARKSMISA